uniref:Putative head-tail connector n=1 Tax=viral metagenome TaxID=1070528 RepID=A0A6M3L1M6_9ZZZZ
MLNDIVYPFDGTRSFFISEPPTVEPVSAADLKLYARIDGSSEDTLLNNFISAARIATELWTGRALLSQSVTLTFDTLAYRMIQLPCPPLLSIVEFRTGDEDGTWTVVDSDDYYVDSGATPARFYLKRAVTVDTPDRDYAGYQIEYTAGYGSAATDVPMTLREAVLFWATYIYENRVPITVPPKDLRTILEPFRVRWYLR